MAKRIPKVERKMIRLSEYADKVGIHYKTAMSRVNRKTLEVERDDTGHIWVKNPDYCSAPESGVVRAVLYARVSSTTNKASLDGQIERMRTFAAAKGYTIVAEFKEIASGLNEDRKQLSQVLMRDDYDVLVVEHMDRLSRFGGRYIKLLLERSGARLDVINEVIKKDKDIELVEDFVSIVTSFCGRIYGRKRAARTQEIIDNIRGEVING